MEEEFDGLDEHVTSAVEVYFEKGYGGGSFVNALLAQDWRMALLSAHEHLSRRSIIVHMDYAKRKLEEHNSKPTKQITRTGMDKNMMEFLCDEGIIGFFPGGRTLKSGRLSYWYANCRRLTDLQWLASEFGEMVQSHVVKTFGMGFDYVYGVPEGATKLAMATNMLNVNPDTKMVMGRAKPKEHGDPSDKYFIGPLEEGDRVVVLEDVTTTGGSLVGAMKQLREAKVKIIGVVAVVNRDERNKDGRSVPELIREEFGCPYTAMFSAREILPFAIEHMKPEWDLIQKVVEHHNKYAVEKITI